MSEQHPEQSPEQRFVGREIQDAVFEDREISDAAARVIAGWWHGGQASALYSFASCGAIDRRRLADEYVPLYVGLPEFSFDRLALDYLGTYWLHTDGLDEQGNRGPVPDWIERTRWEGQQ